MLLLKWWWCCLFEPFSIKYRQNISISLVNINLIVLHEVFAIYCMYLFCVDTYHNHVIINASEKNAKPLMKKTYFNWIKTCCFAGYLQYLIDFRKQLQMIRWLYSFLKMISITNRFCNLVELLTLPRKLFNKRDMTILYLLDIWETLNIQKLLR